MARLNMNRFAGLAVLALSASVACFAACSSDNGNPAPGGPDSGSGNSSSSTGGKKSTGGSGNSSSTGGKSGGKKDGGSGGSSSGGETGDRSPSAGGSTSQPGDSGSGGNTSGGGGDAGTAPPEPLCKPGATGFFSKTCTDSKCTGFDNSQLQNLNNGQLPPLQ